MNGNFPFWGFGRNNVLRKCVDIERKHDATIRGKQTKNRLYF